MKAMLDTSVLVPALVCGHPMHSRALPWLARVSAGDVLGLITNHIVAELFCALTRLQLRPRVSASMARDLIDDVLQATEVIELSLADYVHTVDRLASLGVVGGAVYDGIIATAAQRGGADALVTLNPRHFLRVWPEGEKIITVP